MLWKLQQKFIPNQAPENTKIRKDLAVEKFKSEIKLLQTRTDPNWPTLTKVLQRNFHDSGKKNMNRTETMSNAI